MHALSSLRKLFCAAVLTANCLPLSICRFNFFHHLSAPWPVSSRFPTPRPSHSPPKSSSPSASREKAASSWQKTTESRLYALDDGISVLETDHVGRCEDTNVQDVIAGT